MPTDAKSYSDPGFSPVSRAVATTINGALTDRPLSALTFVSADRDLLTAARHEGLSTDDPNMHS